VCRECSSVCRSVLPCILWLLQVATAAVDVPTDAIPGCLLALLVGVQYACCAQLKGGTFLTSCLAWRLECYPDFCTTCDDVCAYPTCHPMSSRRNAVQTQQGAFQSPWMGTGHSAAAGRMDAHTAVWQQGVLDPRINACLICSVKEPFYECMSSCWACHSGSLLHSNPFVCLHCAPCPVRGAAAVPAVFVCVFGNTRHSVMRMCTPRERNVDEGCIAVCGSFIARNACSKHVAAACCTSCPKVLGPLLFRSRPSQKAL